MAFTNELLFKTMQVVKNAGGIADKRFLMLGKQTMDLHGDILTLLEEAELIDDQARFGEEELNDSVKFFKAWGFKEVHALDVSDYENADIIFNLNDDLPNNLHEKFDVVYDGGVIEHVFDVGKALRSMCQMVSGGGIILNLNPIANYLHNVFWNISPELFIEFYQANGYKILESSIITFLSETNDNRPWSERPVIWSPDVRLQSMVHPLRTGEYVRSLYRLSSNPHPHTFIVARKTNSEEFKLPIPSGYRKKHEDGKYKRND